MKKTQTVAHQLELDLWQDLKIAHCEPDLADLQQLWQDLEQVIEHTHKDQQLRVVGDAIASIVEVYAIRANAILSDLEVFDNSGEPVLSFDFLDDLMRQSMSIDLSDMMEDLFPQAQVEPPAQLPTGGTLVAPIDKQASIAIASKVKIDAKQMLEELAGNEQVSTWAEAIADWMQQRGDGGWVSLHQLHQVLGMPIVDIWLGLLLSDEHQYNLEQRGGFYSNAHEILLKHGQR